jgi:drug/metabolite transporter (DMT)-like permease
MSLTPNTLQNKPSLASTYIELHLVVVLFGFTAILGKLISISALELVFYRTLLASIGLFFLLKYLKKTISIGIPNALKLMGIGSIVAIHWFLFFYAGRIANVSVSLVGLATCTLFIALLQPFFNSSKISIIEICLGVAIIIGLSIIFKANFANWLGLLLSVLSAFAQAIFSMSNSNYTQKYHSFVITFYEMVGASIFTLAFILITGQPFITNGSFPSISDWGYLLTLAIFCSLYAYSAIVRLLKTLSAFAVNLVVSLEPVYGIILAFLIFGDAEKMTLAFYIGTLIICLSIFGYQIYEREPNKKV